jgi:hypothetical protein
VDQRAPLGDGDRCGDLFGGRGGGLGATNRAVR